MNDQINELPQDGLKSSPEMSRYRENTCISRKIKISCTFLHLIDIFNDLILIFDLTLLDHTYQKIITRIITNTSIQNNLRSICRQLKFNF